MFVNDKAGYPTCQCQLTRRRRVKPAFEPQTRLTRQCPGKPA